MHIQHSGSASPVLLVGPDQLRQTHMGIAVTGPGILFRQVELDRLRQAGVDAGHAGNAVGRIPAGPLICDGKAAFGTDLGADLAADARIRDVVQPSKRIRR